MDTITLTIDGRQVQVAKGSTVLEAARAAGINVPTLCYHPELRPEGACRLCVVEIKGGKSLAAACVMPAANGMEVYTNTPLVREARRIALELLLANHPFECLTCERSGNCELQTPAHDLGVREVRYSGEKRHVPIDDPAQHWCATRTSAFCADVVFVCVTAQGVHALGYINRGWDTVVEPCSTAAGRSGLCQLRPMLYGLSYRCHHRKEPMWMMFGPLSPILINML